MGRFSRRTFMGVMATGAAGCATTKSQPTEPIIGVKRMTTSALFTGLRKNIQGLVDQTPFVDTHEHLWEESLRLKAKAGNLPVPAPDFGMLFCHYSDSDLQVAGMPPKDREKVTGHDLSPKEKWKLVAPYYERSRHTGYIQNVRESVRLLFGEDDLSNDNVDRISDRLAAGIQPGYYRRVLSDVCNLEYTQVNGLDSPVFNITEQPDLLAQDISTIPMTTDLSVARLNGLTKREITSLAKLHEAVDWCFAEYGPLAIATKNQCAYGRRLNFDDVSDADAAPIFGRYLADPKSLKPEESKALQDHMMHYCIKKATEYHLPVKLHTGYYAGHNGMPLERVRQNAGDLCPLLNKYRDTTFVLMHIDYPYQDEVIALGKHYSNAVIDMCWAWIINPRACVRFLKEFLMAAPACKVLTFGGDYRPVEMVPGHAFIARKGLGQAVTELIEEGWVQEADAPALIDRIMRGNAHEIFDQERALKNFKKLAAS